MTETAPGGPMQYVCPRCDRPIHDTAYVCSGCSRHLAKTLLRLALRWDALEDAIGRRLIVDHPPGKSRERERRTYSGPWCWGAGMDCGHQSCAFIWRSVVTSREEGPLAHEDPGLISPAASEAAWAAENAVTTWARHVSEERGIPIPVDPEPTPPREPSPTVRVVGRVRCGYSDLPVSECACGHDHQESA